MKNVALPLGLLALVSLSACGGSGGGSSTSGGAGGTTASSSSGGTGGSGASASTSSAGGTGGSGGATTGGTGGSTTSGTGGAAVMCSGANPTFPTFDKACVEATDCVLVFHQVSCCGTRVALGISSTDQAAFAEAEGICEMQYPGCGCAQGPTIAEDGKTADESAMMVQCTAGACSSYVP